MMRINAARLQASLDELAAIGATAGGGVTRLALSDEDRQARDLFAGWLRDAGLTLRVDDFGTMSGRRPGADDRTPAVVLGSHLDSVRQGGRFDGAYGVLGALEVIRTLNDHGVRTRLPLEIVNWTNEEGVRFEPAMMSSGAVAGRFAADYVHDRTDRAGLRFGDELRRIGYHGAAADRPGPAAAYLELHIEQGPVLEDAGAAVGVVEGIVGITWLDVVITGHADHAGPSPMPLRRDALAAAAQLVLAVQALARATQDAVGTVGRLVPEPNIINTIPGRVTMSVDFRHRDPATLDDLVARFSAEAGEVAAAAGVVVELNRFWTSEPTPFAPEVVAAVADAAAELGEPAPRLWSGAGHDAKYTQLLWPSAMIFARSEGGLSHCEQEFSTTDDLAAGANVLLGATLRLAGVLGEEGADIAR